MSGATASAFYPLEASCESLLHGGVIIAGSHSFNAEVAVVAFTRALMIKHDAGGNGRFAMAVANVKTLQALRRLC
ncbi:hypothetical protein HSBAA_41660 [Vreelandella sulfidaeris]|uniref:Uncharacterized protein n=1 Tax=Vreelandella sulfidaeris TaxID=115553 RepID=A0A455U9J2_9GAMM|nr:hypothetical protein HSBAA_41660 [Halomonas sulfidaeris]